MTPQSQFLVLAPVDRQREGELRALLDSMNVAPGVVDPDNPVLPFAKLDTIHVVRFVLLDDKTVDDARAHGMTPGDYPLYLAFLGDVDGDADAFLAQAARVSPDGLRSVFACCEGFTPATDLLGWMRRHSVRSAANYVNWVGRTARRVREDAALRDALEGFVQDNRESLAGRPAAEIHAAARRFVDDECSAGRLTLSPEAPTPAGWRLRNLLHLVGVPVAALVASPVLVPVALVTLLRLRALEKTDPELCWPVEEAHTGALSALEDHDVTNQFTAMGTIKPGLARRWMAIAAFFAIDYFARHVYTHGGLARVRTIHFARWVFLDDRRRAVFLSNYDGSLESYMDDFINKVGFGLNLAFSGGIGYPRTRWLVLDGCGDERKFKEYLRRHQVPTQVWYKAYPGLTAVDLERNGYIRRGLESPVLDGKEVREWMALL